MIITIEFYRSSLRILTIDSFHNVLVTNDCYYSPSLFQWIVGSGSLMTSQDRKAAWPWTTFWSWGRLMNCGAPDKYLLIRLLRFSHNFKSIYKTCNKNKTSMKAASWKGLKQSCKPQGQACLVGFGLDVQGLGRSDHKASRITVLLKTYYAQHDQKLHSVIAKYLHKL